MSRNGKRIISDGGFSLLELLTVITIIGFLFGIAAIFGGRQVVQSKVEGQTRELYADLMNARVGALQKNRIFFVTLAPYQYSVYEDTFNTLDGNGLLDTGAGQDRLVKQRTTAYRMDRDGGPTTFSFSSCGLMSEESYTIHIVSNVTPNFDCIVLNPTRLLMGTWNGTNCSLQ